MIPFLFVGFQNEEKKVADKRGCKGNNSIMIDSIGHHSKQDTMMKVISEQLNPPNLYAANPFDVRKKVY